MFDIIDGIMPGTAAICGICGCGGIIGGIIGCAGCGCTDIVGIGDVVDAFVMKLLYPSTGLKLPVGVRIGVPTCFKDAIRVGGNVFGTSTFLSFKLINLHAMLNSIKFIFPSASVSASALN